MAAPLIDVGFLRAFVDMEYHPREREKERRGEELIGGSLVYVVLSRNVKWSNEIPR